MRTVSPPFPTGVPFHVGSQIMKCTVITPVGPGHKELAADCIQSVADAMRQSKGLFDVIAHSVVDDTNGHLGRSAARNKGVADAIREKSEWLFFLDADDLILPDVFAAVQDDISKYDAVFGQICEQNKNDSQPRIRDKQQIPINSIMDILNIDPFFSLQMGHFVRTTVAHSIPFNVSRNTGEDFEYYLKLWHKFRCIKIQKPLFINRRGLHSSGPKAADGMQWRRNVYEVMMEFVQANRSLFDNPLLRR